MKAEQLKKISDAANGMGTRTELDSILDGMSRAARSGKYFLEIEYAHRDKIRTSLIDLGFRLTTDKDNSCKVYWDNSKPPRVEEAQAKFKPEIKELKLNQQGDKDKPIIAGSVTVTKEMIKAEALKNVEETKVVEPIELVVEEKEEEVQVESGELPEDVVRFVDNLIGACPNTIWWWDNDTIKGDKNCVVVFDSFQKGGPIEWFRWENGKWFSGIINDVTGFNNSTFTALVMNKDKYS